VDEPVDHGCGNDVVTEDIAPADEGFVAGDDQARAFVAGRDELEEQVRGFGFERDVADLVDDQQRDPTELDRCVLPVPGGPRKTTFSLPATKSRVARCAIWSRFNDRWWS
jgi:hypothetical protein